MKNFHFGIKILLVSSFSLLIITLAVSTLFYSQYQKSMIAKTSASIMQSFIQANEFLNYNIDSYENTLYLISVTPTVQRVLGTDYTDQYSWFTAQQELISETNKIAASHMDIPNICYYLLREQDISIPSSFTNLDEILSEKCMDSILESQGIGYIWSDVCTVEMHGKKNHYLIISKLLATYHQKNGDAIVYIRIYLPKFFSYLDKLQYDNSNVFVLSQNHEILFDSNKQNIGTTYENQTLISKLEAQSKGYFVEKIQDTEYLVVFNSENKRDWTLIGILPYDTVMNEIISNRNFMFGITFIVTFILFLLVYLYLYNNMKQIALLCAAMMEVGNGSFDVQLQLTEQSEIKQMADIFLSMLTRIKQQIKDLEESHKREYQLELVTLQEQINPHLLYNTLATINSYAEDIDAIEISQAIMTLISYYKLSLSNGMNFITVKDELTLTDAYIQLMRMRYSNELIINTIIDPQVYSYSCPKLILQPFVENSILHGFSKNEHYAGVITLEAILEDVSAIDNPLSEQSIIFKITDNGCGMNPSMIDEIISKPGSYAIKNVDARIKLYFNKDYGIRIKSTPGKMCEVSITIPAVKLKHS